MTKITQHFKHNKMKNKFNFGGVLFYLSAFSGFFCTSLGTFANDVINMRSHDHNVKVHSIYEVMFDLFFGIILFSVN